MIDVLRIAHLRIAPQEGNSEVGNCEVHLFVLTDTDNACSERYSRQKKPVDVTLLEAVFQLLQGKCKY